MLAESSTIAPHGGYLVDRRASEEERKELVREALGLPRVHLDARTLSDLQMIASGVFSPLEGFMLRETTRASSRTCASRAGWRGASPSLCLRRRKRPGP